MTRVMGQCLDTQQVFCLYTAPNHEKAVKWMQEVLLECPDPDTDMWIEEKLER